MKLKIFFLLLFLFVFSNFTGSAQGQQLGPESTVAGAYRFYKDIGPVLVNVPTVVEVPFGDEFIERLDFVVFDKTVNLFEPYFLKQEVLINEIPFSLSANPSVGGAMFMADNNVQTYADFPLPENQQGQVQITLTSQSPITSFALTTLLDNNVALPTFIEIRAFVEGSNRIVLAKKRMDQNTVRFPQTTSSRWIINFTFAQPLRISELRLGQKNATQASARSIRFLAQPSHSYLIYFDPDRQATPPVGESANLANAKDILFISASSPQANPAYKIADADSDGVPDIRDNCISLANSDQKDVNNNGRGDLCDDFDQDSLINSKDNCPNNPNRDQLDMDSDGIGDVCDKEESRITERYKWIPWLGIGFAVLVLIVLLVLTARSSEPKDQSLPPQ